MESEITKRIRGLKPMKDFSVEAIAADLERDEDVIRLAFDFYARALGHTAIISRESQGCIYWTLALYTYFTVRRVPALVQGGTAMFRFRGDEAEGSTHYSYMCTDNAVEFWKSLLGQETSDFRKYGPDLPEMHAWLVVFSGGRIHIDDAIVVDWTTRYLKDDLLPLAGYTWGFPKDPPKCLVIKSGDLGCDDSKYEYQAKPHATELVLSALRNINARIMQCK